MLILISPRNWRKIYSYKNNMEVFCQVNNVLQDFIEDSQVKIDNPLAPTNQYMGIF